jgi:endonuclease-8
MEGPSLFLAKEQLKPFQKKRILVVEGNTTIEKERFLDKEVKEIFSWGKHLLFQFDGFALRVHFLLFGTFTAKVNGKSVTGDYEKPDRVPRLAFTFENGRIDMFNCSVKIIEDMRIKKAYDFTIDVMSSKWDPVKAYKVMKLEEEEEIADVLLDQEVFAGVGNIIKNEILSIARVSPLARVKNISPKKRKELIKLAQSFSKQFYTWRKSFVLRKHLLIHRKGVCPHCGRKVLRAKTGKKNRWSYWCEVCQKIKV